MKTLTASINIDFRAKYVHTGHPINPNNFKQEVNFNFNDDVVSGVGSGKADKLFKIRETITQQRVLDFNSFIDSYNELENVNAIKAIYLRNYSNDTHLAYQLGGTTLGGAEAMEVTIFQGVIGPVKLNSSQKSFRFLWTDFRRGLLKSISESESEPFANRIILTPGILGENLLYELVMIGASSEESGL